MNNSIHMLDLNCASGTDPLRLNLLDAIKTAEPVFAAVRDRARALAHTIDLVEDCLREMAPKTKYTWTHEKGLTISWTQIEKDGAFQLGCSGDPTRWPRPVPLRDLAWNDADHAEFVAGYLPAFVAEFAASLDSASTLSINA